MKNIDAMEDFNKYIKKSHIKMVEKFNEDLEAFRRETGADAAELYEDPFTSFTLANVCMSNGCLVFEYDGKAESHKCIFEELEDGKTMYYEDDIDGVVEWIRFWRKCLNRARRYWSMDVDTLDSIQDGSADDSDDDD